MIVEDNVDLAPYTTFGIHRTCRHLITVSTVQELAQALERYPGARILGGGSNVLVTQNIDAPVIHMGLRGIVLLESGGEQTTTADVRVAAGERWHDFVGWCVDHDLGGLENLALIPGTVGAAPMQNIGAYGVEQERCFVELQAMERSTREIHTFDRTTCEFGYRESVFKNALRDRYVIVSVTYRLAKAPHQVNVTYRDVDEELHSERAKERNSEMAKERNGETVTIRDVYEAVVRIRTRKLPDPAVIGNAGSFFKNPVVSAETYAALAADHVEMPHYPQADGSVKLAAAWLIDQCGWKGYREDGIGVHDRQALVLVNHDGATGADIIDLAQRIQRSVKDRFGVDLMPEVNVW